MKVFKTTTGKAFFVTQLPDLLRYLKRLTQVDYNVEAFHKYTEEIKKIAAGTEDIAKNIRNTDLAKTMKNIDTIAKCQLAMIIIQGIWTIIGICVVYFIFK